VVRRAVLMVRASVRVVRRAVLMVRASVRVVLPAVRVAVHVVLAVRSQRVPVGSLGPMLLQVLCAPVELARLLLVPERGAVVRPVPLSLGVLERL
jgi:hypothetical protein